MDFTVDIKPEDVNKAISDAILKSTVGDQIRTALAETFKGKYGENPFTNIVATCVHQQIMALLRQPEYEDKIKALTRAAIDDAMVTKLVSVACDEFIRKLNERD